MILPGFNSFFILISDFDFVDKTPHIEIMQAYPLVTITATRWAYQSDGLDGLDGLVVEPLL